MSLRDFFPSSRSCFLYLLLASSNTISFVDGGKPPVHITDDLDDVVDDEEDDSWRQWGKNPNRNEEFDPPDFSRMDPSEIQAEMVKRHIGPAFGFVKLRLGVRRTPHAVGEIAIKWSKVLRTGGIVANFMAIDISTIMCTLERGQDFMELKEFVLKQPEAYEVKIGNHVFRRPGDPSLDQVVKQLNNEDAKDIDDL